MKFRDIFILCRDNYDAIQGISCTEIQERGRICYKLSGWNDARDALMVLKNIGSLNEDAEIVLSKIPELYMTRNVFIVSIEEWDQINAARNNLLRTMDDTIDLYAKMDLYTGDKIGVDVKLPHFDDFSDFVKYLNEIEFVLTKCPFLQSKDEKLQFENVDIGSTWLTFIVVSSAGVVGGSVLLNNIAAFVDKCIIIRSHFLTTQKQKNDLEAEKRNEEEKRIILKYIDDMYKKQVDAVIKELEDITQYSVENKDGDELSRIDQCIEKMGVLIDKGLQIRASIDSSNEIKALFEPLEMKYLEVSDTLKLLENKEEE